MYLKNNYQRYKGKSNFFEHDDRVCNTKKNKGKSQNILFKKYKKYNQKNKNIPKDNISRYKQNLIMCYCHCSISQIHANTTFCCAKGTERNCRGIVPVNWKFFQPRCQCGVCQINILNNIKRSLSPSKLTEIFEKENHCERSSFGKLDMFSTSPQNDLCKTKVSKNKKQDKSSHLTNHEMDVSKVLHCDDLKQILKGISNEKIKDAIFSKKNKKKKKKRHKKSKYKSSKSEKSENENRKRRKSRKYKKSKRDDSEKKEVCHSLKRSSSSKKIFDKNTKNEIEEDGIPECKKKKKFDDNNDRRREYTPEEPPILKLSPTLDHNSKTDENANYESTTPQRPFSKSLSPEIKSSFNKRIKRSKSKSNEKRSKSKSIICTPPKLKCNHKQEEFQHKSLNNNNINVDLTSKSPKSNKILNIQDKLTSRRPLVSHETKRTNEIDRDISHDIPKSNLLTNSTAKLDKQINFDILCNKDSINKNHKKLFEIKIATNLLSKSETMKENKKTENEMKFDSYNNENVIAGQDLDSYVNAIMTDEYKEKKLNDFKLLEQLKNNIAIKAKEKLKSIEKVSSDNFSTIPSVNKFISGIISESPESVNNNKFASISAMKAKNLTKESSDFTQKNCKFLDDCSNFQKDIPEEKSLTSSIQKEDNDENYQKLSSHKMSRSSERSRSNSSCRYSTGSSYSSQRSKYSYSSSRYSYSYSRSSSSRSSDCSSHTRSRSRSHSRSPSIPRRRGSPSFLERRRITSARKRPVPYNRVANSSSDQTRQIVCNTYTTIIRKYQPSI